METRKPIARYMIGSIIDGHSARDEDSLITLPRPAGPAPVQCRVNLNSPGEMRAYA
jgi:hypothetical protein